MTSPERRRGLRRTVTAAALTVLAGTLLSGCELGQPATFTARAEKDCATATRGIDHEIPVTDPLAFAIDRFAQLDHVLVVVSTDRGFPGGAQGRALDQDWVIPARASLKAARPSLNTLRGLATTPSARRTRVFRTAVRGGETGVNAAALRRLGLTQCATLFTMPAPALTS